MLGFIRSLVSGRVRHQVRATEVVLLWTLWYMSLSEHIYASLLGLRLRGGLLGHRVYRIFSSSVFLVLKSIYHVFNFHVKLEVSHILLFQIFAPFIWLFICSAGLGSENTCRLCLAYLKKRHVILSLSGFFPSTWLPLSPGTSRSPAPGSQNLHILLRSPGSSFPPSVLCL